MFEWDHYLVIANKLVEIGDTSPKISDAAYRSAISRAYYAAYNKAKLIYNRETKLPSEADSYDGHGLVWMHFKRDKADIRKKLGELGVRLREFRNLVDYQVVVTQEEVRHHHFPLSIAAVYAVKDAQKIVDDLGRL
ncbi:hypothetical protein [Herpetosiphon geysericola]|uniref:HEPN domain-containing protein n=1 Tax=Herpetosiphon geysericola TaxID=70996 RepID=A0A0P6Y8D5_9CHLR|nr:hypothetical protein [Herpetosiphon geysericola]KPL86153.1 hypothetical protein SE18_14955 [Herpetosiphon geysericola]